MKRCVLLLTLVAGCSQPPSEHPRPEAASADEFDFASWRTPHEGPYPVELDVAAFCRAPAEIHAERKKEHGPHYKPAIIVRVNPIGFDAFRTRKSPLPVGTVIVKEKHDSTEAKGPPKEYGAMVKREAGYDPTRGDWEYVYVVREPERKVTRGQIESCIYCHVRQMEQDYVFRTYLK